MRAKRIHGSLHTKTPRCKTKILFSSLLMTRKAKKKTKKPFSSFLMTRKAIQSIPRQPIEIKHTRVPVRTINIPLNIEDIALEIPKAESTAENNQETMLETEH